MIFRVTMKTPDALEDAIKSGLKFHEQIESENLSDENLSDEEIEEKYEDPATNEFEQETILSLCKKWFRHNECVTLEINIEEKTCVVVPVQ